MKRKDFLKASAPIAVMPALLNGMTFSAYGKNHWLANLAAKMEETDHVLVLIQLNGGNDGLNTVIPKDQYSALSAARSNVLIPENKLLKLDGSDVTTLHPSMTGMREMYDNGLLNIVQGVGYPNPDFSHFRSTDIWVTGSDSDEVFNSGWLGRYLSEEYANFPNGYPNAEMPDPLAIQIGSIVSPVCQGLTVNMGMAVTDPEEFYQLLEGQSDPLPNTPAGDEVAYVRTVVRQTNQYADVIVDAAEKAQTKSTKYPVNGRGGLGEQLKIVARLIAGGLKTRVYITSIGGFDTHSAQVDTNDTTQGLHAELLKSVSDSVSAFQDDLKLLNCDDRVLGMTFSEFGRRIKSNGSNGTDHGTSAPLFVFGKHVKGGITGDNPTISSNVQVNDNLPMQYDFRSVYSTLLKDWFCLSETEVDTVMIHDFQHLDLVEESACFSNVEARKRRQNAGDCYIVNYPNPFVDSTQIKFYSSGEHVVIQIFDPQGRVLDTLVQKQIPQGEHEIRYNASHLPSGNYYVRLQMGSFQQTRALLKVR